MLTLITGGADCGKSTLAETICTLREEARRLYIATMRPLGEEALERIARHRRMRAQKGFDTLERYENLAGTQVRGYDVILLECVGNLLANEMYRENRIVEDAEHRVLVGIDHLLNETHDVVIVSNDVSADGTAYAPSTMRYVQAMAAINQAIAARADHVAEVVCGIPIFHKGGNLCLLR